MRNRNQRYQAGHVTGSEIFHAHNIIFERNRLLIKPRLQGKCRKKGPNNTMSAKLWRKQTVFNEKFTLAFGRHVG